ncbi:hypothetical protein Tco_1048459 [Tanacetum coccineum]
MEVPNNVEMVLAVEGRPMKTKSASKNSIYQSSAELASSISILFLLEDRNPVEEPQRQSNRKSTSSSLFDIINNSKRITPIDATPTPLFGFPYTAPIQEKTRAVAAPRKPKNGAVSSLEKVEGTIRF